MLAGAGYSRSDEQPFQYFRDIGGISVAAAFRPHLAHGLVQEALSVLGDKFASIEHVGPRAIAAFDGGLRPEEVTVRERDAFERIQALLRSLSG